MKKSIALGLTFGMFALAGCQARNYTEAETAAIAAVQEWLILVDQGEYAESWETAARLFKSHLPLKKWQALVAPVRNPLGKVIRRELRAAKFSTSLPGVPDGEYVVVQFTTTFQNKKTSQEILTPMRDEDGQWRVSGYYLR